MLMDSPQGPHHQAACWLRAGDLAISPGVIGTARCHMRDVLRPNYEDLAVQDHDRAGRQPGQILDTRAEMQVCGAGTDIGAEDQQVGIEFG